MTTFYIGTSGWAYTWNHDKTLTWYTTHSHLNAIELNMSYYRFPYPNMITSWTQKGEQLAWVIKIHRLITHIKQLNTESYSIFERFTQLFQPMKQHIHYYLLQLPPKFTNINAVEQFINKFSNHKFAVEFRHPTLFTSEIKNWAQQHKILLVSVDAPNLPKTIMSKNICYIRIHGRNKWYQHQYTHTELTEIADHIMQTKPEYVYIFFNNNHAMLQNAQTMHSILTQYY